MKVDLNYDEAKEYYGRKGLVVRQVDDEWYSLSRQWNEELRSVFPEQRPLTVMIPKEVDYLAGGSFIDPFRMMPTTVPIRFNTQGDEARLFTMRELSAVSGWATVGRFWLNGTSPTFALTKMSRAQYLLVCTKWDKRVNLDCVGLEVEVNLRCILQQQKGWFVQPKGAVLYFNSLTDAYGMSGIDCFVIPLVKSNAEVQKWLEIYRQQKQQLIKYSEAEYRIFKREKGMYAAKILKILPQRGCYPDNVRSIRRNIKEVKDEIIVEYITGAYTKYRCDAVGLKRVWQDYGKEG